MTSPNEPGYPGAGDSPNGKGWADRGGGQRPPPGPATGRISEGGEVPPWQRGAARPPQGSHRPAGEPPAHHEPRSPGRAPSAETRLSRFISGTAAPGATPSAQPGHPKTPARDSDPAIPRSENPRTDAYASELPDLSGSMPRSGQRKAGPDAPVPSGPGRWVGSANRVEVSRRSRGPVRASMQIRRIDPWSTLKVSLVLSVALFFVWMIAVAFLYLVLGGMGVWSKLNSNVGDLLNNTGGSAELVSGGTIFGGALLIGLVNIVLLTAMATIGAFVYNLTTDLIGGVEVTLADRD